ncbi:50S ribosomal protein L9 [Patescibacteria group bacterium]|nr:50S ribosomal protein L9 [Patescibacteria group bacterium]
MKVILQQYVRGVGDKGDVIDVSDGYAQNALIPRGLAKAATSTEINKLHLVKKTIQEKEDSERERILTAMKALNGKTVTIQEKVNGKGTLYQTIGVREIIRVVYNQFHISTPNTLYTEKYAFKECGEYELTLQAYDSTSRFYVVISSK